MAIVVLGAGRVAAPALDVLTRTREVLLVDADAAALAHYRATFVGRRLSTMRRDISRESIDDLVHGADAVVSLLPAPLHILPARACIAMRVPLVTTSYISEEMRALDSAARAAGVTLLNECGLDPGIDHMLAMRSIDEIHGRGGLVREFESACGGLPARRGANPWEYQLSWAPRGVVTAARATARYLENRAVHELPPDAVFAAPQRVEIPQHGMFEAFYNRDSIVYAELYGVRHEATRFARATLRYEGWCETFAALYTLGVLDDRPLGPGSIAEALLDLREGATIADTARAVIALRLGTTDNAPVIDRLIWLGLATSDPVPAECRTTVDLLVSLMEKRLGFGPSDVDRVVLRHRVVAEYGDHAEEEIALLIVDGIVGGPTAMARTVSVAAATAALLLTGGAIDVSGVITPIERSVYEPLLASLHQEGITVSRTIVSAAGSDVRGAGT